MRIKRLIVRKTSPKEEIIRNIKFNLNGISLITDETTDNLTDTGNSVGKSTVIEIIDLCLGASDVTKLYNDKKDTRNINEKISSLLNENKVTAELQLLDSDGSVMYIKKDLFENGENHINGEEYKIRDFQAKIKEFIFKSTEQKPTLRQLIPKFIRLSVSEDKMFQFIEEDKNFSTYDTVYSFLFQLLDKTLASQRDNYRKLVKTLNKDNAVLRKTHNVKNISSLYIKLKSVEIKIQELIDKRNALPYRENFKKELNINSNITSKLNSYYDKLNIINYEIKTILDSIHELKKGLHSEDSKHLKQIYDEAHIYFPQLSKTYGEMVDFHNAMVNNRIKFIESQLSEKETIAKELKEHIEILLDERQKLTIDVLDNGLLDKYNELNSLIQKESEEKGALESAIKSITKNINDIEENEVKIKNISDKLDIKKANDNIDLFNKYFNDYSYQLYGEGCSIKYNYNENNSKAIFPVALNSHDGDVGTGKKKALIFAFDMAYMKFAQEKGISCPDFVIHDKVETIFINQMKIIFEICKTIDGQYIFPVLQERISGRVPTAEINERTVLKLSSNDRFFRV